MGQMSKIFARSCDNENSGQGDIKSDIKIQQKMLMAMIDKPIITKEEDMGSYSSLKVKSSAVKYSSSYLDSKTEA